MLLPCYFLRTFIYSFTHLFDQYLLSPDWERKMGKTSDAVQQHKQPCKNLIAVWYLLQLRFRQSRRNQFWYRGQGITWREVDAREFFLSELDSCSRCQKQHVKMCTDAQPSSASLDSAVSIPRLSAVLLRGPTLFPRTEPWRHFFPFSSYCKTCYSNIQFLLCLPQQIILT